MDFATALAALADSLQQNGRAFSDYELAPLAAQYFHGGVPGLAVGAALIPLAHKPGRRPLTPGEPRLVYFTTVPAEAWGYARDYPGGGSVYVVRATGPVWFDIGELHRSGTNFCSTGAVVVGRVRRPPRDPPSRPPSTQAAV